jgi:hypothetical protein
LENYFAGIDSADAETPMHMRFEQASAVLRKAPFGKGQARVYEKGFPVHARFRPWKIG